MAKFYIEILPVAAKLRNENVHDSRLQVLDQLLADHGATLEPKPRVEDDYHYLVTVLDEEDVQGLLHGLNWSPEVLIIGFGPLQKGDLNGSEGIKHFVSGKRDLWEQKLSPQDVINYSFKQDNGRSGTFGPKNPNGFDLK